MEKQSEKPSIELIPPEKFEEYPFSKKIAAWIINVGRVVIIATELVAFSVFVGRIKLDRELTDLTDTLENKIAILENAKGFESDFRDLQQRLEIIKGLRQNQIPASQTLTILSSLLPEDVKPIELTLEPQTGKVYLLAKTGSATSFAKTILNLKNSSKIEEIALTSGRFSAKDSTYHFSLAIKFGA